MRSANGVEYGIMEAGLSDPWLETLSYGPGLETAPIIRDSCVSALRVEEYESGVTNRIARQGDYAV